MNPIKEWFKKKASDKKFKSAGPAHKLSGCSTSSASNEATSHKKQSSEQHRISKEAERAAAAALERVKQQKQTTDPNW